MSSHSPAQPMPSQTPPDTGSELHPRTALLMVCGVTIPIVILDQLTKLYVSSHMQLYENISLIANLLDITYVLNPGAAFSLLVSLPGELRAALLFLFSAIAVVVILVLLARSPRPTLTSVALALILAGASGNLVDRLVRGRVIDFVRAHYYSYNWPIFNVADSAITIGVILILIGSLFSARRSR